MKMTTCRILCLQMQVLLCFIIINVIISHFPFNPKNPIQSNPIQSTRWFYIELQRKDDDNGGYDGYGGAGRHNQAPIGRERREAGAALRGRNSPALRQRPPNLPLSPQSRPCPCSYQDLRSLSLPLSILDHVLFIGECRFLRSC